MSDAPLAAVADRPAAAQSATGAVDLWRIPGEAMPGWVIGLAGLVGTALAVVAIDPWLTIEPVAVTEPAVAVAPASVPAALPSVPVVPMVAPSAPVVPMVAPSAPVVPMVAPSAPAAVVSGEAPRSEASIAEAVTAPAVSAPEPAVAPAAPVVVVAAAPVAEAAPPTLGPTATALAAVSAPAAVPTVTVPPCLPVVGIAFARGSSRLESGSWEAASEPLRRWVAEHPGTTLSVEGHADTSGTEDFNLVLSFARARAAVAGLGRLGVGEDRMIARAAGTDQPRNGPAGITTNRLVVLRVDGVDVCRDVERTRQP